MVCKPRGCVALRCVAWCAQIFINGKHIGGNDDLQALNASGELDRLLEGVERRKYDPADTAAPQPGGLFNIDSAGVKQRFVVGSFIMVIAIAVALATTLGSPVRWWRIFTFMPLSGAFVTWGQSATKT